MVDLKSGGCLKLKRGSITSDIPVYSEYGCMPYGRMRFDDIFLIVYFEVYVEVNEIVFECMYTSWFMLKTPNFVSHECRMQHQLECHILRSIWYHADRHGQWKRVT